MRPDGELWKSFLRGDKTSFSIIFKTYYEVLYHYAYRFTHDDDRTKDYLQDLFMNIWRNRTHLSEVEYVKSYLMKSLRRTIMRELNNAQGKLALNEDMIEDIERRFFYNFNLQTDSEHLRVEKLKEVLSELSFQQKEVLFLRYYNDLDFKEIAEIMALSYQSVRNYAHQSISKLRKYLLIEK